MIEAKNKTFDDFDARHDDDVERLMAVNPRDADFMKVSRRVCLISRDDATEATGFIVGPDLMLTTAHALLGTSGIFADPAHVRVKFDQFIWNASTGRRAQGDECGLRYIPFTRQPDIVASSIQIDPKSRHRFNDKNDLDYVLVRLDRPIGLSFLPYSHRIRGWNDCSRARIPAAGSVFVVQHPLGGLQKFASGTIPEEPLADPEFRRLFQYTTESLIGASGSPIFDPRKRVVGMHVGERAEGKQLGVSFQKIFADLQRKKVTLPPFRLNRRVMDSIFGTSAIEKKRKPRGRDWRGDRLFDDVYDDDRPLARRSRP